MTPVGDERRYHKLQAIYVQIFPCFGAHCLALWLQAKIYISPPSQQGPLDTGPVRDNIIHLIVEATTVFRGIQEK
jgi:hypothetical protein